MTPHPPFGKLTTLLGLAGIIVALSGMTCVPTQPDECKSTEASIIEPRLKIRFAVTRFLQPYANSPVEVVFQKQYCDGTLSGRFPDFGQTDANGIWTPVITPQFKLANTKDVVLVEVTAVNQVRTVLLEYDQISAGLKANPLLGPTFETTLSFAYID